MMHDEVSARHLGAVRIGVFAMWIASTILLPLEQLGDIPAWFLDRLGVLRVFSHAQYAWALQEHVLQPGKGLLLGLLSLALLGVRPYRLLALTAALLLTFAEGVTRGFTFLNHGEMGLLCCTFALALAPASDGFALWPPRRRARASAYASTLLWMTLLFLTTYVLVGAFRLSQSSPQIFFGDNMWAYAARNLLRDTPLEPSFALRWLERPLGLSLLNIGFALTTFFEVISPLCLLHRRLRYVWILVIAAFHVLTLIFMHLFFWQNLLLLPLLMLDRSDFDQLRRWRIRRPSPQAAR